MKVVFWSNIAGHSALTSSMLAISVMSVLDYDVSCACLQTQHRNNNLMHPLVGTYDSDVSDYLADIGIDALVRCVKSGTATDDAISRCSLALPGKKLNIFPPSTKGNKALYESDLCAAIPSAFQCLDTVYELSFIDTTAGVGKVAAKAISEADVLVIGMSQDSWVQADLFNSYQFDSKKLFFLFGDYDRHRKGSLTNCIRTHKKIMSNRTTAAIPHCTEFADALDSGTVLKYFLRNRKCEKQDLNYEFITSVRHATDKLMTKLHKKKKNYFGGA